MKPYQPAVTSDGERIALFGVEPQDDGAVLALGCHSSAPVRRGRVLTWGGERYRLETRLPGGLALVGGPPGHMLDAPIVMRKGRRT